jgi:hypothetical protein
MNNIGATVGLGKMGFKLSPAQERAVAARAAAKKKIGDLSFKPTDAQKKAILAREMKKVEEAPKENSLDKKLEEGVKKALQMLNTTDLDDYDILKESGLDKLKKENPWSPQGDNKDYLKVENYIYDNFDKESKRLRADKGEQKIQKEIEKFKEVFGSKLPTTKAKAIHVPKKLLEVALRVGGFSPEEAKKGAGRYYYKGDFGFMIHKAPKSIVISEAKSDFEKEMDAAERMLEKDLIEAFSRK